LVAVCVTLVYCANCGCGMFLVVFSAPDLFARIPSRDVAGGVFCENLRRFESVKQVLSLLLVLAVFFQLERTGGFAGQSIVSGVAIFVAIASNVYLAMVLRPRMGYFRDKVGSFDTASPDDPWRKRFDGLHCR